MQTTVDEPLSAGSLARRLGVATTTLRTWHQRYGLGPSEHESGRHRRYTPHDIARLTMMAQLTTRGVPAAEAARRARRESAVRAAERPCDDPGSDAEARGLARAARRMDVLGLREAVSRAVAGRGVVRTWHAVAGPAFQHIDRARCPETRKVIARRLLARSLGEVLAAVPRPPAGTPVQVMLVAADDGRDVAALDALAAALAERGIASAHLGAGLDSAVIAAAITRACPAVLVFWSDAPGPATAGIETAAGGTVVVEAGLGRTCPDLADAMAAVTAVVAG
ncbi:MerR family transcriptional regulator [Actinoplanes couchii]|uniref:MerR family transcriptional regulator n=1 Tax=Actinoplanes couchii TaxID=403638 RepID=A0ABQ3XLH5_9ACTN|nr:MerR family transcriptional regulator [Actinoplanes couchii]MDR6318261.1 DNA-binding transcriptional MerR regulator [Actinoplanes couchii]GID59369.1 MerR family transcriptional regulator [Actinoplanes couchii]